MNLVSNEQWSGWFAGLGSSGVVLQNVLTAITPWIFAALAIFFGYKAIKNGIAMSHAENPEQRLEAKKNMGWFIFGAIIAIIAPTLVLSLMNTIGKTVQTTGGSASSTTTNPSMVFPVITLNIPKLDFQKVL